MALHSFLELKVGFLECKDPNPILQNASPFPVIAAIQSDSKLLKTELFLHNFVIVNRLGKNKKISSSTKRIKMKLF